MEQAQASNTKCLIGFKEKEEFLNMMASLFPDQDLLDEKSKFRKKADLTFQIMQMDKWKVTEFQGTMKEFARTYCYTNWMPANIISIWKDLYGQYDADGFPINNKMVL